MSDPGTQLKRRLQVFSVLLHLILETPLSLAPMSMSVMPQVNELTLIEVGPEMQFVGEIRMATKPSDSVPSVLSLPLWEEGDLPCLFCSVIPLPPKRSVFN